MRNLTILAVMVVALVGISAFAWWFAISPASFTTSEVSDVRTPPPPPSLTRDRTAAALATKSFSLLVSYTDQGFEPAKATVHVGDVVRFTNNSTKPLWITGSNYPGKSNCGTTALDTCKALPPGEYYEFTFDKAGTWTFGDKDTSITGSIIVSQ